LPFFFERLCASSFLPEYSQLIFYYQALTNIIITLTKVIINKIKSLTISIHQQSSRIFLTLFKFYIYSFLLFISWG
jgi:hypothetical protein